MFHRRSFLRCSLAGLGLNGVVPSAEHEFERPSPSNDTLDALVVHEGHHPISPERVIVMTDKGGDGWSNRNRGLETSLRASFEEPFSLYNVGGLPLGTYTVPLGKLDLIFRLMRVMTDHYKVPDLFADWATTLAKREALGTTGFGKGFGLLHQFQGNGLLELTNPPVDWWLVLFPKGIEWEAVDRRPVFGMIAHVFSSDHQKLAGLKLRAWELASRAGLGIGDPWARIASMSRMAAAQFVNRAIIGRAKPQR